MNCTRRIATRFRFRPLGDTRRFLERIRGEREMLARSFSPTSEPAPIMHFFGARALNDGNGMNNEKAKLFLHIHGTTKSICCFVVETLTQLARSSPRGEEQNGCRRRQLVPSTQTRRTSHRNKRRDWAYGWRCRAKLRLLQGLDLALKRAVL